MDRTEPNRCFGISVAAFGETSVNTGELVAQRGGGVVEMHDVHLGRSKTSSPTGGQHE